MSWLNAMLQDDDRGESKVLAVSPARCDSPAAESRLVNSPTEQTDHSESDLSDTPVQPGESGDPVLFVATTLETWQAQPPLRADQDEECERSGYRRLDAPYYAWLRSRMTLAQQQSDSGRLPAKTYEVLRDRFNAIHAWALQYLGEAALKHAVATTDVSHYQPPRVQEDPVQEALVAPTPVAPPPHCWPPEGVWGHTEPVSTQSLAKVDAIREQALAAGWTQAQLYQNRGQLRYPYGEEYGLVCAVGSRDSIGEITPQWIEIITSTGARQRLYNRLVEQPWIRKLPP